MSAEESIKKLAELWGLIYTDSLKSRFNSSYLANGFRFCRDCLFDTGQLPVITVQNDLVHLKYQLSKNKEVFFVLEDEIKISAWIDGECQVKTDGTFEWRLLSDLFRKVDGKETAMPKVEIIKTLREIKQLIEEFEDKLERGEQWVMSEENYQRFGSSFHDKQRLDRTLGSLVYDASSFARSLEPLAIKLKTYEDSYDERLEKVYA